MPTTKTSHPIRIKIYNINSQLLEGATVTLTLADDSETTVTSNSSGEAVLNVANAGDWSVGDEVSLTASKTGEGTKTSTLVLDSSGGQETSLTLAETSDLYYGQNDEKVHVLNFSLLTTYDGEKVTNSNPLPVSSETTLNEPAMTVTYDSSNRLSTQTITVRGTQYTRTFTYTGTGFQFTSRSAWIKI